MKKHVLALDLKDDPKLIAEYERYHQNVWPEILKSLKDSGIQRMEIFRILNRLVMIIEVDDSFSFPRKAAMDNANPKVQEWETLMLNYQQKLPLSKPDEKWREMVRVFDFRAG